jgi:hypothetical protein
MIPKVKINLNLLTNWQTTRSQHAFCGEKEIATHISISSQRLQHLFSRHNKSGCTTKFYKTIHSPKIKKAPIMMFCQRYKLIVK